jgi:centractin
MDPAVVIDTGSGIVKAGFASEPAPKCLIPNVVGVPARRRGLLQRSKTCTDETLKELYVGDDALKEKARLELKYPMENSRIVMWDEECEIWNAAYSILDVKPSDQPVYMLTNPFNGPEERQFLSEVFFETYDVPALYFQVSAVASLYASGRVTGLAIDSGECVTHAIPVYEGFPLRHALFKTRLGGRHVTERLQRLLMGSGYNFSTSAEKDSVRIIKEKEWRWGVRG